MYKKILIPLALDHGLSGSLLDIANGLLAPDGEIVALHVVEAAYGLASATHKQELGQEAFDRARDLMRERLIGTQNITAHVIEGHVYRGILDFAQENSVDCIVMGSHKPGLSDYLIGSTAARVVRHATCAVHVHRTVS